MEKAISFFKKILHKTTYQAMRDLKLVIKNIDYSILTKQLLFKRARHAM